MDLSLNYFTSLPLSTFGDALKLNSTLKYIDLSNNYIND